MLPDPRLVLTIRSAHLATWLRLNHVEPLGIERDPRTPEIRYQWSYDRTPQVEQLFLVWQKTLNSLMHPSRFEEGAR